MTVENFTGNNGSAAGQATPTVMISRQEVQNALGIYTDLIKASSKYHKKIIEMSQSAAEFASLLDALGKCKGAEQSGVGLKTAAELHRLMAKSQEQLAESIHKDFELPLQRNLAAHSKRVEENEKSYEKLVKKIQDEISKTENRMLKDRKKDLNAFQQSLQDMQRQAQELEKTKQENIQHILSDEQKNFMFLVQKAAGVVKSEYDFFNSMAAHSREATEEIISIAFAPPGKILDVAEKRRVVDKFLGGTSAASTATTVSMATTPILGNGAVENGSMDRTRTVSSISSVHANGVDGSRRSNEELGSQRLNLTMSSTVSTAGIARASSPSLVKSGSFSAGRLSTSSSTALALQESLNRLNIATSASNSTLPDDKENSNSGNVEPEQPMVKTEKSPSFSQPVRPELDLVIAIHEFTARTERELSFKKGDILLVKQRQENWLYAAHYTESGVISVAAPVNKSGWIPVSYVAKFQKQ